MQSKNNLKINPFVLFAIFLGGAIIALPLRVYQLLTIVEPGTGFWADKNVTVYILYAVVAAVMAACILISYLGRGGIEKQSASGEKKPVVSIIAFLTVIALLYNAIVRYGEFSDLYFQYSPMLGVAFREYLTKTGAGAMALEAFFAVISAVYFLLYGISSLTGKSPSEYKLLAVAPVLWCIFRLIHRFMRTISFLNVSELFFELCMIVVVMMFFMAFAQVTSRVNGAGLEWKLFGYGLPAALFCLICFLPRLIVVVIGKSSVLTDNSPIEYCDLACAAFIISTLVSRTGIIAPSAKKPADGGEPSDNDGDIGD